MKKLIEKLTGLKTRLLKGDGRTTLLSAACVALIIGGGVWMFAAEAGDPGYTALNQKLSRTQIKDAKLRLTQNNIPFRVRGSRILVKSADCDKASSLIRRDRQEMSANVGPVDKVSDDTFSAGQSLWRSESQNARIWQARKMSELGRLISKMDPVQKAVVLYEAGKTGGLGSKPVESSAAVHVTLKEDYSMTAQLVVAIGDLVSGSVRSLRPEDVKIVDSSGISYLCDASAREMSRIALRENDLSSRVADFLGYQDASQVTTVYDGRQFHVRIKAPGGMDGAEVSGRVLDMFGGQVAGVVVENANPQTIEQPVGEASLAGGKLFGYRAASVFVLAGVVLGFCGAVITGRGNKTDINHAVDDMQFSEELEIEEEDDSFEFDTSEAIQEQVVVVPSPFDFLKGIGGGQILEYIREEKPRTIAIVLKHLNDSQVREVMGKLSEQWQGAVTEHMSGIGQIDPQIVEDIASQVAFNMRNVDSQIPDKPAEPVARSFEELEFEDLITIDSTRLGNALDLVSHDDLAISIRTAGREMKKKLFGCMPASTVKRVKRRIERIGPVRLCEVEVARQRVTQAVSSMLMGSWVPSKHESVLN